ncbi:MAG: amidohydrolase family protein, partial [Vicinamibacterales bacterium]
FMGEEQNLGSLEPGKLADLVVIGGDFLKVPARAIGKLPIRMTIVGGKVPFDDMRAASKP